MVIVAVAAAPLVTVTVAGLNEQYGAAATTGVIERQASVTVPV
jgi:hypothetical protein